MLELILFILSTAGFTLIITTSYLFKNIREFCIKKNHFLGKLVKCSQCTGFWVGLIVQSIQILHNNDIFDLNLLLYGFTGSFVSYLAYLFIKPLIDKYD